MNSYKYQSKNLKSISFKAASRLRGGQPGNRGFDSSRKYKYLFTIATRPGLAPTQITPLLYRRHLPLCGATRTWRKPLASVFI